MLYNSFKKQEFEIPHNEIYFEPEKKPEKYTVSDLDQKRKQIIQLQNEIKDLINKKNSNCKSCQSYQIYIFTPVDDILSPSQLDDIIKNGEKFKKELQEIN